MPTPWADLQLCTIADLRKEVGDTTLLTGVIDSDQNEVLYDALATFKAELKEQLMSDLQDIFAHSTTSYTYDEYLLRSGYSYSDLDSLLDKIVNPNALKLTAQAGTISVLARRQILQGKLSGMSHEALVIERANWEKITKDRYAVAKRNIRLDLDGDGESSDFERPRTHNTFFRG